MVDPLLALSIALVVLLAGLVLFLPELGLVARWRRAWRGSQRVRREDALKHIHRCEIYARPATLESLAGALNLTLNQAAALAADLQLAGLAVQQNGAVSLTAAGRDSALHILRAHRLWERYLADHTGYSQTEWHDQAEQLEHRLSREDMDALAARLGFPTHDPHGDPIPGADGHWVAHGGTPLNSAPQDQELHIVHIEDEPAVVYAQIVAEDLHPGMSVRLIEVSDQRVRFWAGGDEHVIAPVVAANISVRPAEAEQRMEGLPLSELKPGGMAQIVGIAPPIRGLERRRLLDLGLLPGTLITAEFASPGRDPTAYRVRDTLIALRADQARAILVSPQEAP